jgi:hypothetical protein
MHGFLQLMITAKRMTSQLSLRGPQKMKGQGCMVDVLRSQRIAAGEWAAWGWALSRTNITSFDTCSWHILQINNYFTLSGSISLFVITPLPDKA